MRLQLCIGGEWKELDVDLDMNVTEMRAIPEPLAPASTNYNAFVSSSKALVLHQQEKHLKDLRDEGSVVTVEGPRTTIKSYSKVSMSVQTFIAEASASADFCGPPGTEEIAKKIFQAAESVRQAHPGCPDCVLGEALRPFRREVRKALGL